MSGTIPPDGGGVGNGEGEVPIRTAIIEFLREHKYLHEFRLQKLIYIAELVHWLRTDGESRLTEADYKPYMFGSYSEKVRKELRDLQDEVPHEPDRQYGNMTTKYLGRDLPEDNKRARRIRELVKEVREATRGIESTKLEKWSKQSWLYQNTDYDEEMDFEDIMDNNKRDRVRSELEDISPELIEYLQNN